MLQLSSFLAVKSSILHLWRWLQIILPSKLCAKAWDISRKLLHHPVWRKEGRCISTSDPMLREKMFESTGSSLPELSFIFTKGRGSRQDEQGCELNQYWITFTCISQGNSSRCTFLSSLEKCWLTRQDSVTKRNRLAKGKYFLDRHMHIVQKKINARIYRIQGTLWHVYNGGPEIVSISPSENTTVRWKTNDFFIYFYIFVFGQ